MKVILTDDGPAKSSGKSKQGKEPRPRSQRSSGFRRRQPGKVKDIDELIASGATEEEETAQEIDEVEEAPPQPAPKAGTKKGGFTRKKPGAAKAAEPSEPEEEQEEVLSPEPEKSSAVVEDIAEEESRDIWDDPTEEEEESEDEAPAPKSKRKFGSPKAPKVMKGAKPSKPAKDGKSASKPKFTVSNDSAKGRKLGSKKEKTVAEKKSLFGGKGKEAPLSKKAPKQRKGFGKPKSEDWDEDLVGDIERVETPEVGTQVEKLAEPEVKESKKVAKGKPGGSMKITGPGTPSREAKKSKPESRRYVEAGFDDEDEDEEAFNKSFASSRKPAVIREPESVGSQLLTLIEIIAGAAISFFAATQVGNILLTNIMSGTLGG